MRRWTDGYVNLDENCTFYATTCAVDGVECRIHEWQNRVKQNCFYSYKASSTSIKYQVATQVDSGSIVNVTGPCVGSSSDMCILNASSVPSWLLEGEKMVVDLGYVGPTIAHQVVIKLKAASTPTERAWCNLVSSVRIDVERVIAYLKRFRVLRHTYIKSVALHGVIFHFLSRVVNLRIRRSPIRRVPCSTLRNATMKMPWFRVKAGED